MFLLSTTVAFGLFAIVRPHEETCYDKFEYVFKVMERLSNTEKKLEVQGILNSKLEEKMAFQEEKIAALTSQLHAVTEKLQNCTSQSVSDTYTRWGRSSCPNGTTLVYDGFAAGSLYKRTGGAANYICLTKVPKWNDQTIELHGRNLIYGAEYEMFKEPWRNLLDQEVPCAVCRAPRSSVHVVHGTNGCHQNYTTEYTGYLMSDQSAHPSATELVCVDEKPESASLSSDGNENGRLFYFVQAKCGSLKCPPYEEGKKITCAVCSI